jgi:VCBS repeat-containing protein
LGSFVSHLWVSSDERPQRRLSFESFEPRRVLAGTWTQLTHNPPSFAGTMMLLTDGTVMVQGQEGSGGVSKTWQRLTPDSSGNYINGTWSNLASMSLERLYVGSNVLPNGNVFVVGGEYSGPSGTANWTNTGEMYNSLTNSWSAIANFPQSQFGDDPTMLLGNGKILCGYLSGTQTYLYNPANNTWAATGPKRDSDRSDEETWVLLPDGSVLSYDVFGSPASGAGHAQKYVPASGTWVDAGAPPAPLSSSAVGFELGPATLLPDGRVFQVGGNSNTALYNPGTNTWTAGPSLPAGMGSDDAPGVMLPNGHFLFTADTTKFQTPTKMFDFDPGNNSLTDVTPGGTLGSELASSNSFWGRFLMLPNGHALFSTGWGDLWDYAPTGSPQASWAPTINNITTSDHTTFTLTGLQLTGLSQGASYGDDAEMDSNYPIVRLTNGSSVYYARTSGWTPSVATGNNVATVQFTLPAGLPNATYQVTAIANGIASTNYSYAPLNTPPVTVADGITVNEGGTATVLNSSATSVLTNDTDAQGDTLHAILVSGVSHGSLTLNNNGTFSYTHDGSETTSDSFTYKANDGIVDGNTVTVSITVNPVNDAPVTVADSITVNEGGTTTVLDSTNTSVLTNDTDAEGDTLHAILVSNVSHGSLTLNDNGTFSYTHDGSETTSDSFTYKANDGTADGNTVTVSITVNPVNDAPVTVADSITVNEGGTVTVLDSTATSVLANDTDAEGNTLSAILVSNVSHGSLTLNGDGTFSYTHDGSETTSDSFTYKANDGSADGNTVTVSITVNPVNDAPVTVADSITVNEGGTATVLDSTAASVLANDTDAEGNTLSAILVSNVSHGSLTLNGDGTFSYTHDGSETTSDSFTYKANDGAADGNTVTISITVNPVNDAPQIAGPTSQSVALNGSLVFKSSNGNAITLSDPDYAGKQLQLSIWVSNGTLALSSSPFVSFSGGTYPQSSFTLRGTIGALNQALNGMTYTPSSQGSDTLQMILNDLGNTGSGGPQQDTRNIGLTIGGAQSTIDNGTAGYSEVGTWADSSLKGYNNSGTRFSAKAAAYAKWTPTLAAGYYDVAFYNVVNAASESSAQVSVIHNGTTDSQTIDQSTGVSGFVTLGNFYFNGGPGEFVKLSHSSTNNLRADAVRFSQTAAAPTITAPASQNTVGALTFSVNGGNKIAVNDLDAAGTDLQLSLAVSHGNLTLASTAGLSFTSGANGDASFTVQGPLTALNAALDGLSFAPTGGYKGTDSLQVTLNDLGNTGGAPLSTSKSVALNIGYVAIGSPTTVIDNGGTGYAESSGWATSGLTGYNGTSTRFSGNPSAIVTWTPALTGRYEVEFYKVANSNSAANAVVSVTHNSVTDSQIVDLTTGPSGFVDLGAFDLNSSLGDFVRLSNQGTGNLRADAVRFTQLVAGPSVSVPASQSVAQDSALALSPATGNAISIADPDAGATSLQVALTVTHGALTLGTTTGLSFVTGGNGQASFTVSGTQTALNNALASLSYQPTAGYSGSDTLHAQVTDADNLSASQNVPITVIPVVVVDNGGAGYGETGAWFNSGLTGSGGSSTRFATGNATATWTPILSAGTYKVEFYKVANPVSSTAAKVTITHNGTTFQQYLDLTAGSSGFVDLGTFQFNGSGTESLGLAQGLVAGTLRADAVRFTKVG